MNSNKVFSYSSYNYKNYSIKELLYKKLKLKSDYKVESLKDIEQLSILFLKNIPYCTFDAGIGKDEYNIDYTIKCIEIGGLCTQLNIIFGLFLKEVLNLDIYLFKSVEISNHNIIGNLGWHFYNVFIWRDKKVYYHDVGLFKFNVFSPIEIDKKEYTAINDLCVPKPFEHRVILNPEFNNTNNLKSYILQKKLKNEAISIIELKLDIHNLKDNVTFEKMYEISHQFLKLNSRLILLYSDIYKGIVSLNKSTFILFSSEGSSKDLKIKITVSSQIYSILQKYFNIDLNNNGYYKQILFPSKL